jgi:predicted dehydrogenase
VSEADLRVDSKSPAREISAPALPYLPPRPRGPVPGIGLIGCGGIAAYHLEAYKAAGFPVVALCNRTRAKAEALRDRFYPTAAVCTDYREVLAREDVQVVDLATHPETRAAMVEDALRAGKHVLSQKPFVTDLDLGARLCDLAEARGLHLAVNQNGRWAPHWSYLRHAIAAGLIGEVTSVRLAVQWDHSWTRGTPFDAMRHLILYDFGIHWFDILTCFMGDRAPLRVTASATRAIGQANRAPLLAQVLVEYEGAQASITLDGATPFGASDTTVVAGTRGTLRSEGPDLNHQQVTLHTADGVARPALEGEWFRNGFVGTMAELLCAMEDGRAPYHSARHNLRSLALCFAAMASADRGAPIAPGTIRKVE